MTITTNPDLALAMAALGALGIYAEFCAPGKIVAGVTGAVLAILGAVALSRYQVGWPGAVLILAAFACFALEAKFVSRGLFTIVGTAAMLAGSKMLIPAGGIRWTTAILVAIPFSLVTSFLLSVAVRAKRNKAVTVEGDMLEAVTPKRENEAQT